jgi:3-deoxy-D-glycero-D-galacto-nononate 9-phosphate synthase
MIKKGETYIIGEIGQNHNGSVDIAHLKPSPGT